MIFSFVAMIIGGIIYLLCGIVLVILWVVPVAITAVVACIYYFCKFVIDTLIEIGGLFIFCIHSLVDRIRTCIERTAAFKWKGEANKNIEIKQTEEPQESER